MINLNSLNILHIGDKEFKLLYSDPTINAKTYTIVIPCELEDINETVSMFEDIDKIEIYEYDNVTLNRTLTTYNTHTGNFSYLKDTYVDENENPIPAVKLVLKETDYESLVKKLNNQLNPSVDYSTMTEDDFRELCIEKFNKECSKVIFAGVDVETEYGTEHFAATDDDQRNIKDIFDIAIMSGKGFAYHADKTQCKVYSYEDIIKIYMAIKSLVLYQTTYCNALNSYARKLVDKSEMSALVYGQDIPDEALKTEMEESLEFGKQIIEALAAVYLKPEEEPKEEPEEPAEDTESPNEDADTPKDNNEDAGKEESGIADEEDGDITD